MKRIATNLCLLFRVSEWYDSKVPLLTLPALSAIFLTETPFSALDLQILLTLLWFDALFLSFGYLINDFADRDVDRLAGKVKYLHNIPKRYALTLLFATFVAGVAPVLVLSYNGMTLLALLVIYFFGASYSIPPFRFKERGIWGLLVSSTAQRCFPLFLVPILLPHISVGMFILWMSLSFVVGLRYILVHQYIDAEHDRTSGVRTFAIGKETIVLRMIQVCFALEMILLVMLIIPIFHIHFWISLITFSAYFALFLMRWNGCLSVYGHSGLYSFDQIPLEDFYNHFMPLLYCVLLTLQDWRWVLLILLWIIFLLRPTADHVRFPLRYMTDQIKKLKNGR